MNTLTIKTITAQKLMPHLPNYPVRDYSIQDYFFFSKKKEKRNGQLLTLPNHPSKLAVVRLAIVPLPCNCNCRIDPLSSSDQMSLCATSSLPPHFFPA
jgi:hypothetical protein